MTLRTEYDAWHERVFEANREHEDASSPWYQLVREKIGSVAGLRVLEVACGRGGFVRELARNGARVTGCDFSFSALRVARAKLDDVRGGVAATLVHGDAQCLPFADASFDLIVSCETIEHLPDVQAAIREMHRVARPGGKLFLTTPNYANLTGLYDLYERVRRPSQKTDQPFDRQQWFPQIRKWVRGAGWEILEVDGTVHQFPILPGHSPIRWEGLESSRKLRQLLSPFALHYFIMAKRQSVDDASL
jgi:ubiquinone/menaquinone biosynthesis C-methylase UbiE